MLYFMEGSARDSAKPVHLRCYVVVHGWICGDPIFFRNYFSYTNRFWCLFAAQVSALQIASNIALLFCEEVAELPCACTAHMFAARQV